MCRCLKDGTRSVPTTLFFDLFDFSAEVLDGAVLNVDFDLRGAEESAVEDLGEDLCPGLLQLLDACCVVR
jgi:hypothetical protein